MKYRPDFPERFGGLEDARAHCVDFFAWYTTAHWHSGLGLPAPHDVHHGLPEDRGSARASVLTAAYAATPERFVRHAPRRSGPVSGAPRHGARGRTQQLYKTIRQKDHIN